MIEFSYGWIKDSLDKKFAPKTTSNLVINPYTGETVYTELNEIVSQIDEHKANEDVHITSDEKTKLSGIEAGAQVNTVLGIKGDSESEYRTGNINITKENIGLSNVDNTSDINKPVSSAQQSAIDSSLATAKEYTNEKMTAITAGDIVVKEAEHSTNADNAINANNADHSTFADKATKDSEENVIVDTYETKVDANLKLEESKTYTDEAVAKKSDVQLIKSDSSEFLSTLKIYKMTQSEYEQVVETGELEENAIYVTPQEDVDLSIYATKQDLTEKADNVHTHNDMYYTEAEIDEMLSTIATTEHNHNDIYYTESEIDSKIAVMQSYIDELVANKTQVQIMTWEADD